MTFGAGLGWREAQRGQNQTPKLLDLGLGGEVWELFAPSPELLSEVVIRVDFPSLNGLVFAKGDSLRAGNYR